MLSATDLGAVRLFRPIIEPGLDAYPVAYASSSLTLSIDPGRGRDISDYICPCALFLSLANCDCLSAI